MIGFFAVELFVRTSSLLELGGPRLEKTGRLLGDALPNFDDTQSNATSPSSFSSLSSFPSLPPSQFSFSNFLSLFAQLGRHEIYCNSSSFFCLLPYIVYLLLLNLFSETSLIFFFQISKCPPSSPFNPSFSRGRLVIIGRYSAACNILQLVECQIFRNAFICVHCTVYTQHTAHSTQYMYRVLCAQCAMNARCRQIT